MKLVLFMLFHQAHTCKSKKIISYLLNVISRLEIFKLLLKRIMGV